MVHAQIEWRMPYCDGSWWTAKKDIKFHRLLFLFFAKTITNLKHITAITEILTVELQSDSSAQSQGPEFQLEFQRTYLPKPHDWGNGSRCTRLQADVADTNVRISTTSAPDFVKYLLPHFKWLADTCWNKLGDVMVMHVVKASYVDEVWYASLWYDRYVLRSKNLFF